MNYKQEDISLVRKWWVILRLFSLPFALVPFAYGLLLAHSLGGYAIDLTQALLLLVTVILFKAGSDLLSDIIDFKKGIDQEAHSISGGIVRGWISVKEAWMATLVIYAAGITVGTIIIALTGWWVLPLGLIGFGLSVFYSAGGKFACKFNFTGEYCVMFAFGVVIPFTVYSILAGHYDLRPVIWSFPLGIILGAVKHANNWLEVSAGDHRQPHVTAVWLGDRGSRIYYIFLVILPYLIFLSMFVTGTLYADRFHFPDEFLLVFLTLPFTAYLIRLSFKKPEPLRYRRIGQLDTMTGALFLFFGFVCCVSTLLM